MAQDSIWIREERVERHDDDKSYGLGDTGVYETCYNQDEKRRLFDDLQRDNGPCRGKVYVDSITGGITPVGWVFEKRVKIQRGRKHETVALETWVTLHSAPSTRSISYNYL